ncbi:MAG: hypothetical protein ACFB21_15745 [Opitutales bacterium]
MITQPKKRKINSTLAAVIMISIGAHVAALIALGSWVIVRYIVPDDAKFEEATEVQEEAPPPDVKVEVKPQPQVQDNLADLRMKQVGDIAVDPVDIDLPSRGDSFTVRGGIGSLGGITLGGDMRRNIGINMERGKIFDMSTRAERILIVMDASKHMVIDDKGGLESYPIVKQEVVDLVGSLPQGTLFNVILFEGPWTVNVDLFKPQPVSVNEEVVSALNAWISPINRNARTAGLPDDRHEDPRLTTFSNSKIQDDINRSNTGAFLTQLVLEQKVDEIFIVTHNAPLWTNVRREYTSEEDAEWARIQSEPDYQAQLKKYQAEEERVRRLIRQKKRRNQVLVGSVEDQAEALGIDFNVDHPGYRQNFQPNSYGPRQMEGYWREFMDSKFRNSGAEAPPVNLIILRAENDTVTDRHRRQIDEFVSYFNGDYRVLEGVSAIKRASSSDGADQTAATN